MAGSLQYFRARSSPAPVLPPVAWLYRQDRSARVSRRCSFCFRIPPKIKKPAVGYARSAGLFDRQPGGCRPDTVMPLATRHGVRSPVRTDDAERHADDAQGFTCP